MGQGAPRLAVRAVIVEGDRLLLVNAYPGDRSDLWCAPGGGVEAHASLPANLAREVHEETGLAIRVGELLAVSEFHDPGSDFHQVELFFAASVTGGVVSEGWEDPEGIVNRRRWFAQSELATIRFKPDILSRLAFGTPSSAIYDPLEPIVA
jgi:8-oxo-dGTP diphosphatase